MDISVNLIKQCKLKDRRAQKELYLQLLPYLKAVCKRYIIKQVDLKDALQESLVLIFKKIDQYDGSKGAFHSWAIRIAINATFNYNKRVSINNEDEFQLNYHDVGEERVVYKNMSDEELFSLMKKMPKSYFDVFNLFVIDCFDHEEISKLLDISIALSRKRLSRGRYWLKNAIIENSKRDKSTLSKSVTK